MLLFYKSGRLRVVIPTANFIDYDWRDIENVGLAICGSTDPIIYSVFVGRMGSRFSASFAHHYRERCQRFFICLNSNYGYHQAQCPGRSVHSIEGSFESAAA
jgi:hypothetical protein